MSPATVYNFRMNRYFTKTFSRFLIAFLSILVVSFGVLAVAQTGLSRPVSHPVDNVALPQ